MRGKSHHHLLFTSSSLIGRCSVIYKGMETETSMRIIRNLHRNSLKNERLIKTGRLYVNLMLRGQ